MIGRDASCLMGLSAGFHSVVGSSVHISSVSASEVSYCTDQVVSKYSSGGKFTWKSKSS